MDSLVVPAAVGAYLLLMLLFGTELVLLAMLERRSMLIPASGYSDNRYRETVHQMEELDRMSRGVGSVFGIGVAFALLLFLSNFIVAAGTALNASGQPFDLQVFTRYVGYGVVGLFLVMATFTAGTNLRGTLAAIGHAKLSSQRSREDGGTVGTYAGNVRRRFLVFGGLYGLLLVPLVMVLR